jgi:hypothetical protein
MTAAHLDCRDLVELVIAIRTSRTDDRGLLLQPWLQ